MEVTRELRSEMCEIVPLGGRERSPDHRKGCKRALWWDRRQQKEVLEEGQCDWCSRCERDVRGLDLVTLLPDYS